MKKMLEGAAELRLCWMACTRDETGVEFLNSLRRRNFLLSLISVYNRMEAPLIVYP